MGDEDRFVELCRAYQPNILAYALRRTSGLDDASDVVGEVFTIAWRRIADVPADEQALPWLYGVARRVVANHHRRNRRHRELTVRLASQPPGITSGPEARADTPDLRQIGAAFSTLRPDDREVLALVGWEGLGGDALAVALGCSRTAARVRLHRARRRFAAALVEHGVDLQQQGVAGHNRQRRAHPTRPGTGDLP